MTERAAKNLVKKIDLDRVAGLIAELQTKANADDVFTQTEVTAFLDGKVGLTDMTTALAFKADAATVSASISALTTSLAGKADVTISDVLPISSNTTLTDEHPGRPRRVTASCTLTIADDRPENWLRIILVDHGVTVSHDFGNNDVLDANGDVYDFGAETPEVAGPARYHIIATAAGTLEIRQ